MLRQKDFLKVGVQESNMPVLNDHTKFDGVVVELL